MTTQLIVESKDRDRTKNTNALCFKINLPDSYRNVMHVELLDAIMPSFLSSYVNHFIYL